MKESEEYLKLSGIQHFMFCKRQWALIHIEDQWNENVLTAEGRIMHDRVHDADKQDYRKGKIILHGLQINSEKLMISGECDAVELTPDENGVPLNHYQGKWSLMPIEYKRGHSKADDCDRVQVTAQAMCLEEMLCCNIQQGALYYGETRHREIFDITLELRKKTEELITEMHEYYLKRFTPKTRPQKGCNRCSLFDICMPGIIKHEKQYLVKEYIDRHLLQDD